VDEGLTEVPLVDPVFGAATVREVYEVLCAEAGVPPPSKFTVPLLVDARARRIVCNESSVLLRDLGGAAVESFATRGCPPLRPAALIEAIDAECAGMYDALNNGVYRCGFATTQAAYDEAAAALAAWLDGAEARLADGRAFLCGAALSEADVRAYVTLVRFDPVYVVHFKTAFRSIRAMPHLFAYLRRVHKELKVGAPAAAPHPVTDVRHIKQHYFGSHPTLNPHGIVPAPAPGEGTELD
jgi:putative glutathione S-transferase